MKGLRSKYGYRVNVLCLAGAMLALGSCMLAWTSSELFSEKSNPRYDTIHLSASDFALQTAEAKEVRSSIENGGWPQATLGAQMFFVGIAVSFVTTIGGFLQLAGVALFRIGVGGALGYKEVFHAYSDTDLNLAFLISVVAGTLVVASIFFQLSPDFTKHDTALSDRLLVFSGKCPITAKPESKRV